MLVASVIYPSMILICYNAWGLLNKEPVQFLVTTIGAKLGIRRTKPMIKVSQERKRKCRIKRAQNRKESKIFQHHSIRQYLWMIQVTKIVAMKVTEAVFCQ